VSERTTSSTTSWNTDWRIYKSSKVFLINNIVIHSGMKSSSASIWISIKLIHHHHSTRLVTSSQHEAGTSSQHEADTSSQHEVGTSSCTRLAHYTTIKLGSQHNN
jgi:hypothetical protein